MKIICTKNFHVTSLLFTLQLATSVHGATIIPRAPNDTPVYVMNPEAAGFHDSCMAKNPQNDAETKQDFIQRAWAGALEMAAAARTRFTDTRTKVGDDGDVPVSIPLLRLVLDNSDPGYLQFFNADYTKETVLYARQIWSGITGSINQKPGDGVRPANNQINIVCGTVENLQPSWATVCQDQPEGKVIASSRSSKDQNSNTLYICDTYFGRDRFDLFKAATEPGAAPDQNGVTAAVFNKVRQLEGQLGTDAKTLLHEWTHLWWIGPTNRIVNANVAQPVKIPPEKYGWYDCADLASTRPPGSVDYQQNADSHAWYAEYGYFKERLGADHWPNQGPHVKPVQVI